MHIYVLNKYIDMKSTCFLCFDAFIVQKFNFCRPDATLAPSCSFARLLEVT